MSRIFYWELLLSCNWFKSYLQLYINWQKLRLSHTNFKIRISLNLADPSDNILDKSGFQVLGPHRRKASRQLSKAKAIVRRLNGSANFIISSGYEWRKEMNLISHHLYCPTEIQVAFHFIPVRSSSEGNYMDTRIVILS